MMARSPRLCIHGPRPSGLTTLRPHAPRLAHSYYTVTSAHLFLRAPTRNVTGDAMPTSLAEALTQLSFLEFVQRCTPLNCSFSANSVTSPHFIPGRRCADRRTPVKSLRMLPPRRRFSLSPRYLLMWQCRRFSTVSVPHPWTLPCRRSHTVSFLRTFLRRWVFVQLSHFLLIRQCRLLYAVWCNMMLPHNLTSRSSSLAVFTRTVLWTAKTLFVSLRHQCRIHMCYLCHRLDSSSQSLPLSLLLIRNCSPMLAALPAIPSSRLSVPHTWEHTLYAQPPAPRGVPVPSPRGNPQLYWLQSSYRCKPLPQTKGSDSSYGQFRATQVQWTRLHCHS